MTQLYDLVVIGGGIIGASTAMQYAQRNPDKRILLIEKEAGPAKHQTGRNSGVIHAGVYYQPGSLKAEFCRQGLKDTLAFCKTHGLPYNQCGKLIVATHEEEIAKLDDLYQNSVANGLKVELLDEAGIRTIEPNINGIKAVLVKDSAITNYTAITQQMLSVFEKAGGTIVFNGEVTEVLESESDLTIKTSQGNFQTKYVAACAGLAADRLVKMFGIAASFQIIPFKGEYYRLSASKAGITKHLIYPVPDPGMPFLGVHLTNMIDGSITVGPNAVLSFDREGYTKLAFNFRDVIRMMAFPGFWKVIASNLKSGLLEMKNSLDKRGYLKLVQRYCPSITLADLEYHPPGIRAQAVSHQGELIHDFLFESTPRSLHVCNAPSPAATAAIPIGKYICDKIDLQLGTAKEKK